MERIHEERIEESESWVMASKSQLGKFTAWNTAVCREAEEKKKKHNKTERSMKPYASRNTYIYDPWKEMCEEIVVQVFQTCEFEENKRKVYKGRGDELHRIIREAGYHRVKGGGKREKKSVGEQSWGRMERLDSLLTKEEERDEEEC